MRTSGWNVCAQCVRLCLCACVCVCVIERKRGGVEETEYVYRWPLLLLKSAKNCMREGEKEGGTARERESVWVCVHVHVTLDTGDLSHHEPGVTADLSDTQPHSSQRYQRGIYMCVRMYSRMSIHLFETFLHVEMSSDISQEKQDFPQFSPSIKMISTVY